MSKKLIFSATLLAMALSGCGSTQKFSEERLSPENTPDVVLSRIDDMQARPIWLKESEPFRVENGTVISTGSTTIPVDHRLEAAYRIAQNNAKAAVASTIEQRLSYIFQQASEDTSIENTQARFIGAESSELLSNYIRPGNLYWEKRASTSESGQRLVRYYVYATVTMPEVELKKAIFAAIRKAEGKGGISADFKEKVDEHWRSFVSAKSGGEATQRNSASDAQVIKENE